MVTLLVCLPWIASFYYGVDAIWYIDMIATKMLVIVALILLSFKHKALCIPLVVVCYMAINQFIDITSVEPSTFYFVSDHER